MGRLPLLSYLHHFLRKQGSAGLLSAPARLLLPLVLVRQWKRHLFSIISAGLRLCLDPPRAEMIYRAFKSAHTNTVMLLEEKRFMAEEEYW